MKKKIALLTGVFLYATSGMTQDLKVNFYNSYVFQDSFVEFNNGIADLTAKTTGGYMFGFGFERDLGGGMSSELTYKRQSGMVSVNGSFLNAHPSRSYNQDNNFLLLGNTRYFDKEGPFQPYAGVMMGVNFMGVNGNISRAEIGHVYHNPGTTNFAWGARVGAERNLGKGLSIKIQGEMLSSVNVYSDAFLSDLTDSYAAGTEKAKRTLYQWNIGGALVYGF